MASSKGNQNAKKEDHGLTVTFYVDAEHVSKLRIICRNYGKEPTDENVRLTARMMARAMMEESIKALASK